MIDSNHHAFVEFSEVSKSYDGQTFSVIDFSLSVKRGEFVTLLGPSGSGKTTCLKMLAGFEEPSSGEIWLNGRPVNQVKPWKRNIGVVFQHYALFPHMTIAENLAFPLQARRIPRDAIEHGVRYALDMVQLQDFADRRPAQLSGGQQQRVAIARALVFEPDLVLMDEPLGALDRRLREEMQYEIRSLQQRLGVTMLYVTHDQSEAMVLSDRVVVMQQGRICQVSTPEALYEEPQRLFVAKFIGENNQLDGRIVNWTADECQVEVAGEIVRAFPVAVTENDTRTCLTIRPERVAVDPDPDIYPNCFAAEVKDIIFLGDYLRIHAKVLGQVEFIVKIPNTIGHGGILPGDTVNLGWLVTDCRALDSEISE